MKKWWNKPMNVTRGDLLTIELQLLGMFVLWLFTQYSIGW